MNQNVLSVTHPLTARRVVLSLSLALLVSGCGHEPPTEHGTPPAAAAQPPRRYTWATAKSGPGCLPRLRAMMSWYETQTERFRQAEFIEGQPVPGSNSEEGPVPDPQGPFNVSQQQVDDYLTTLSRSGYFSAHYVATLRAQAQATERALERKQPPKDRMPNLVDFPLFVLNFDDLMEQKGKFVFTEEQAGRVVLLNDGDNLQRFVFDATCKIDSVSSTQIGNNPAPVQ